MSSTTPPGWYDDGQGGRRWWDGSQWGPPGQQPPAAPGGAPDLGKPTGGPPSTPPSTPPPTQQLPQQPGYGQPGQQYGAPGGQPGSPYGPPGGGSPYGPPGGGSPYGPPGGGYPGPGGAYPGGPPPRRNRTGLVLGIVGGLVALAVVAVVLVLVLGGSDGPSGDDPAETVQAFVDASRDEDCDALDELVTDKVRPLLATCGQASDAPEGTPQINADDVDVEIGDAQEDGDTATVPVTYSIPGEESVSFDYTLVKQDDVWLIDGLGFGDLPGLDDLQSIDPGDLPTDGLPTDGLPSIDPGDLPTDGIPSFDPDDFPTDAFPSEFPTDFESYLDDLESLFPTEIPS